MHTVDVDEIARMLNEDSRKRGLKVKAWEECTAEGKAFWRDMAKRFILECLKDER